MSRKQIHSHRHTSQRNKTHTLCVYLYARWIDCMHKCMYDYANTDADSFKLMYAYMFAKITNNIIEFNSIEHHPDVHTHTQRHTRRACTHIQSHVPRLLRP